MSFLFKKKKTPAELLRENKRMLDKAIRELDRERIGLQNQDKKLIMDIKKMAKANQMEAVKVMAKSLVRNRHAVTKMHQLKSQLQAVSLRMATLKSTQSMADAMRGATRAMGAMNRQMNMPALQKIMRDFEMQNERMEMTSEVMGDAIDDAFEGEDEEGETDELVNSVLDEIGIDLNSTMLNAPGRNTAQQEHAPQEQLAEPMGAAAAAAAMVAETHATTEATVAAAAGAGYPRHPQHRTTAWALAAAAAAAGTSAGTRPAAAGQPGVPAAAV
eukprot:CAMPEP_0206150762 /NCGR_PEP_ID=MMETSP1473-20131121/38469_1 /ASSEMBLY_ACC=CAM_ASM_001109 /TAXON_ID=1461547 /ORGANISM="Stichococcus sp, Strain RCC1054" /LENGTH=272 /DNA_ID=CAMNT_0053548279 /DNA_START=269 /DNA_END=1088 /DNA_ORIENTATION=+